MQFSALGLNQDDDQNQEELRAELAKLRRQVSRLKSLKTAHPPTKEQWERSLLDIQNQVLELIATAAPLPQILSLLAQEVEELSDLGLCSILLLAPDGQILFLGAAPSFPEHYQQVLRNGIPVGEGEGSCGSAVFRRQSVITLDVQTDAAWNQYRELALQYGYRSYWSNPIFSSHGDVLGSLGIACAKTCRPTSQDLRLIQLSTYLAGIAIERQQSDRALKASEEKLRLLNADLENQVRQRTAALERSLIHEALLKRITDRVRDSLDENHILQSAVLELGTVLATLACEAGIYSPDQASRTVCYEYSILPSRLGRVEEVLAFPEGSVCMVERTPSGGAVFACPIRDQQDVLGDLWLFKPVSSGFDELEIRLIQQVASQCAIALRQARLYQAIQAQVATLAELNYLKDDFLNTVSHELRTPISNMKMAIHLLKVAPTPARQQQYLEILQNECEREANLINDLLDLQRLDATTDNLPLDDEVDLIAWLSVITEAFEGRIQSRQQCFSLYLPESLPTLRTHQNSLERILTELLNNACKYTPAFGQIELYVFPLIEHPARIGITIRNQASIPTDDLSRIFEKFYRIPQSDHWKQGGTGLGLSLVQKLVYRLRGSIQVSSDQGWTEFQIQLTFGTNLES
ncbi:GAF domain-containing protein [Leptolyngbya sp. FACHB-8]|uniref:sensor histidine kinase n=1 Tax=unclassified Leptolyngbya TaxID=2650499 RepID=UPI001688A58F|nr:GAF domain-containing protein [Leptolyngbya sp. FACHB-8]MBD1913797.1 GAF domain-containing protein [Leptolyngbya sp. FACHB-8]